MSLRIGIDIDGVLADFTPAYWNELNKIQGTTISYTPPTEWHFEAGAGFSRETVEQFWATRAHDGNLWLSVQPIWDVSWRDLALLADENDVYFISKRPLDVKAATELWLRRRFEDHRVLMVRPVTVLLSNRKGPLALGLDLHMMIDDKPNNLEAVYQYHPATKLYLRDQPWNRDYTNPIATRAAGITSAYYHYQSHIREGILTND